MVGVWCHSLARCHAALSCQKSHPAWLFFYQEACSDHFTWVHWTLSAFSRRIQVSEDAWPAAGGSESSLWFPPRLVVVQMPPDSHFRHFTSPAVSQVFRTAAAVQLQASRPKTLMDTRVWYSGMITIWRWVTVWTSPHPKIAKEAAASRSQQQLRPD